MVEICSSERNSECSSSSSLKLGFRFEYDDELDSGDCGVPSELVKFFDFELFLLFEGIVDSSTELQKWWVLGF
ncbi:hypothetical protein HanPSC8_Chr13g0570671 [Helianthus annuus]|nr:hypothetical protein HanPSC8_Chr13g0570671 [Helianthus annuus]